MGNELLTAGDFNNRTLGKVIEIKQAELVEFVGQVDQKVKQVC